MSHPINGGQFAQHIAAVVRHEIHATEPAYQKKDLGLLCS
jgi:hypothetical protein